MIEGQRAGNIHIASYGPASFARARLTGVKTDAFANDINADGSIGYYSVFFVKADEPLQEDRRSQGQEPRPGRSELDLGQQRAALRTRQARHLDADSYFGKVVFTGSHENAVLALSQGTVDVAANRWTTDDDSNLAQMLHQGHAEERRRLADEEGRFPHHPQVGPDHQRTLRLQFATCRPT